MSIEDKLKKFDPSGVANTSNNIFGLPFSPAESRLVFIPLPWDVTVSNQSGAANGPRNILECSYQTDLYDPLVPGAWKQGMAMEDIDPSVLTQNRHYRPQAERIISLLESGGNVQESDEFQAMLNRINQACEHMAIELEMKCLQYLENGQIPFVVGGDHSTSLGLIRALARNHDFGILQIDAHADMRNAYQGFIHSHASVMYNALHTEGVEKIVQAGIRELCPEEIQLISYRHKQVQTFFDHDLHQRLFEGENWAEICHDIIGRLPDNIYVSLDVDGLDPSLCPGTGTPVPGGLTYNQVLFLLAVAFNSGKRIIGADLVETGAGPLDGVVSSRLLFRMAGMMIKSNQ